MSVLPYVLTVLVLWVVTQAIQRIFSRSPLDNVPGPSSDSFLKGMCPSQRHAEYI